MQLAAITENLSPSLSADRLKLLINQSVKDVFPDATIKDLDGGKSSGNILERFRDAMGGQFVVMPVMGLCGARISARYLSAGGVRRRSCWGAVAPAWVWGTQHHKLWRWGIDWACALSRA